jgi:hypothetical protein
MRSIKKWRFICLKLCSIRFTTRYQTPALTMRREVTRTEKIISEKDRKDELTRVLASVLRLLQQEFTGIKGWQGLRHATAITTVA